MCLAIRSVQFRCGSHLPRFARDPSTTDSGPRLCLNYQRHHHSSSLASLASPAQTCCVALFTMTSPTPKARRTEPPNLDTNDMARAIIDTVTLAKIESQPLFKYTLDRQRPRLGCSRVCARRSCCAPSVQRCSEVQGYHDRGDAEAHRRSVRGQVL